MTSLNELEKSIASAMRIDQFALRRLAKAIRNAQQSNKPFDRNLQKLEQQLQRSVQFR